MMALDLDLSDLDGDDGRGGIGEMPATIPTGLKPNDMTPSEQDNLIDFDLPDIVNSDDQDDQDTKP